ncbi:hypothetical protein QAD02_024051 [Eretmocerus hayati]|uniref:Uncharacterized protein n=1 Tax=Eretmocerus hayati TaxID=131215 RepID=A0ACC2PZT1_9HYME|nr:hypothetical protein QAD02_024051 [Eretmocerus hayati]
MTDEEITKVFKVNRDEMSNVEYEVVPLYHDFYSDNNSTRIQRAVPKLKLKAFNKDYNLFLEKSGHVLFGENTPVFMAEVKQKQNVYSGLTEMSIQYTRVKFTLSKNFEVVRSRKPRAALTVYADDKDRLHFEGTVDNQLIIRPIPERIHDEISVKFLNELTPKDERSGNYYAYEVDESSLTETLPILTHHIVIKSQPMVDDGIEESYSDSEADDTNDGNPNEKLNKSVEGYNKTQIEAWQILHDGRLIIDQLRESVRNSGNNKNSKNSSNPMQRKNPKQNNQFMMKRPVPPPKSKPSSKIPATAYLELLIVIDNETFRLHGRNVQELLKYLAAFWNAVDLRFREFKNPSIRLNIAGIIVAKQPEAAYYLEQDKIGPDTIEVEDTLAKFGGYFGKHFPKNLCKYDAVVGIMNRRFGMHGRDGGFTTSIGGLAHIGQACRIDDEYNGALVRDLGVFDGLIPAAHEIGHLIGAYHDGDQVQGFKEVCNWDDGFIMSYEIKNKNHFHWSKCSKMQINTFLRSETASCLKNRPVVKALGKPLPGKLINRDDQCAVIGGPYYQAKKGSADCVTLECVLKEDPSVDVTFTYSPPEGVSCGNKKVCLDGECVPEP